MGKLKIPREKTYTNVEEIGNTGSASIGIALSDGWVITFPQGTTKPWKPIRKGTYSKRSIRCIELFYNSNWYLKMLRCITKALGEQRRLLQ